MIMTMLIILVLGLAAGLILPWWGIAVAGFIGGLWKPSSGWKAMGAGFIGAGLLWTATAGYIHLQSDGILTVRVAAMVGLEMPALLVPLTGLLAGLVAGLAAGAGFYARDVFTRL